MKARLAVPLVLLLIATAALSQTPAQQSFAQLKTLSGSWEGKNSKGMPLLVTFEDTAAGSALLSEIHGEPDKDIPQELWEKAECVIVIPSLKKAAFVFGGEYGQGVASCRTPRGWSAPVFVQMAGGSFGFQIGGQSTDLILVAVNDRGFQDLLKDKFKIGGDASAAAGPVGRNGTAATDWKMSAELLSYSRNKGLFAGIDLDGTSVSQNSDDTAVYYGQPEKFETVLRGDVPVPPAAVPFGRDVAQNFMRAKHQ